MKNIFRTAVICLCIVAPVRSVGALQIVDATLVEGRADTLFPAATIGNLDGAGSVAGNTLWDPEGDGFFELEKRVGFSWSEAGGMLPSELSSRDFTGRFTHRPLDVNPVGVHAGFITSPDSIDQLPYVFHPSAGFEFLPLPRAQGGPPGTTASPVGFARAVSDDGLTVVGAVQDGPFSDSTRHATVWSLAIRPKKLSIKRIELPTGTAFSNAWEVNADGTVIVGDLGPDRNATEAARWIAGQLQGLQTVGTSSTARLTSSDGTIAAGFATVDGRNVLVVWNAVGAASIHSPPLGTRIESLAAITPDGSAIAGVLSEDDLTTPFGENWAPFVWSDRDGFVVIPENGREQDYDLSEAIDLSHDGNTVVGKLRSSIVAEGDPPTLGYVWTRAEGLHIIDDLLVQSELTSPTFVFEAFAVSGDGLRVLGKGNPTRTDFDTNAVILDLVDP